MTTRLTVCVLLIVTALLAACSSNVNEANYDKITTGMKEDQVGKILGIASESRSSAMKVGDDTFTSTQSRWRGDKGTIVVVFFNSEVQSKIYYPPGEEPKPDRR